MNDYHQKMVELERKADRATMWWHLSAGFVLGVAVMQILNLTIQLLAH